MKKQNESKRIVTTYPDGSISVKVVDTRTLKEKLTTLTFADKLALMYPTSDEDVTKDWMEFDDHKRLK